MVNNDVYYYFVKSRKHGINRFIEEVVLEADRKGAKVVNLGLLSQASRFLIINLSS